MDPKILVLVVVSVFAVAPEFTNAVTPAFCNESPAAIYIGEPVTEKWSYDPKNNKCRKVFRGDNTEIRNYFDTEEACLKTCQPEKLQVTKDWIMVNGRCLCRCPNCSMNKVTGKTKSNMTPKPEVVSRPTITTTEPSLLMSHLGK